MKRLILFFLLVFLIPVFIDEFAVGMIRAAKGFGRVVMNHYIGRRANNPPIRPPMAIHSPDFTEESYVYRQSQGGVIVTAKMGNDSFSSQDGSGYLLVTLEGENLPHVDNYERKPLNLSIVIDRSGSMSGRKLDAVKDALKGIASYISPRDKVSLVVYDNNVKTLISPRKFDRELFLSEVNRIESGGSTNLAGGLRKGLSHVSKSGDDYLNRVILLSDGLANVGTDSPEGLANIVESYKYNGISVSTIGVGADYDETLMTTIAKAGRGNYHFMENPSDAPEIFAAEFDNLTQIVATDVKVEFNLDHRFKISRGVGYDYQGSGYFAPYDIQAGRKLTYLFEIKSGDLDKFASNKAALMSLVVKFKSQKTLRNERISMPISINLTKDKVNSLSDDYVYEEFMRSYLAEELGNVYSDLDEQKNAVARETLDEVYQNVNEANIRLNGVFDSEVKDIHSRQQFTKELEDKDVNSSSKGKIFQKSVQFESYSRVYNK